MGRRYAFSDSIFLLMFAFVHVVIASKAFRVQWLCSAADYIIVATDGIDSQSLNCLINSVLATTTTTQNNYRYKFNIQSSERKLRSSGPAFIVLLQGISIFPGRASFREPPLSHLTEEKDKNRIF